MSMARLSFLRPSALAGPKWWWRSRIAGSTSRAWLTSRMSPHNSPVRTGELCGDILEVSHARDVDPAIRDRHHHFGPAKAEGRKKLNRAIDIGKRFADQVLAGNAELDAACFQLVHDLCR